MKGPIEAVVTASSNRGEPQDAAARARIVASTDQSMLVEAAAGTGKTTLIVDRILQGICDGKLRLPGAVAITFTEKAAGELESRIREALAGALAGVTPDSPEAERLRSAVEELDRANISTIHAFCARLLREKSAEAGVDPEFAVLEQAEAEILRERAWREWMGLQVAEAPEPLVEALRAGISVTELKEVADALAAAPELLDSPHFELPVPSRPREELVQALCEGAGPVAELFRERMRGKGNRDARALRDLALDIEALGPAGGPAVRRKAYALAGLHWEGAITSFREEDRLEVARMLAGFTEPALGLGAHLAKGVFDWLCGFVRYYGEVKLARSAVDFQDLLVLTARMLRDNPAARRYFQHRFDAFFVDEFQDTDPLQAEMIAYLCEHMSGGQATSMEGVRLADGRLFAVGDPKQSIYRFRRADVQIYERFKNLFGAGTFGQDRVEQVSCNFRSVPRLLEWLNRAFDALFVPPDQAGVYQAAPVPLMPGPDAPDPGTPPVVALCPPGKLIGSGWKAPAARRYEARYLARVVRDAVDGNLEMPGWPNPKYRDFAFLFRAFTDVSVYEEALETFGIPYRVVGGKHFYQREQVVETLAVLRAIADPLDEPAIVGALRSAYFGLSDEELFRYREGGGSWNYMATSVTSGPVAEALARLAEWRRSRNSVPPQVLLRRIFAETNALRAFELKPAGEQRVANLLKLLNRLRGIARATGTFDATVRHLSTLHETELPEEESSVVEPGDDFVLLMTMHKAKGLEFDIVVLPDLGREFRGAASVGPLVLDRLGRQIGLRLSPGIRSGDYEELATQEHGNRLAEECRLLYVACTRARRLLLLSLYWQASGKPCFQQLLQQPGCLADPDRVPFGRELDGVHYVDTNPWADQIDVRPTSPMPEVAGDEDVDALLRERELWLREHNRLIARVSEAEPFLLPSSMEAAVDQLPFPEEQGPGAGGKDFGSLFHNLMAVVPLELREAGAMTDLVRNLARIEADGLGLGEAAADEAAALGLDALRNDEFRALLDGAGLFEKEAAFAVLLRHLAICPDDAAGLVEGSIDLLVRDGERATILDYKTDRFAERGRPAVEARYWPQLALYALAAQACGTAGAEVELALFFVRSGRISRRRMDPDLTDAVGALVARQLGGGS